MGRNLSIGWEGGLIVVRNNWNGGNSVSLGPRYGDKFEENSAEELFVIFFWFINSCQDLDFNYAKNSLSIYNRKRI
jgi:hypothetical protein